MNRNFSTAVVLVAIGATGFVVGRWSALRADGPSQRSAGAVRSAAAKSSAPRTNSVDGAVPRSSVHSASEIAARMPGSLADDDARERAIEQWAETDPLAAITFVRAHLRGDRQGQALSAVLAIWGKNDPASAWHWVSTEMPTATYHFDTLLEAFGKQSTETAVRYAARYAAEHPEATTEVYLAALLGVTYRGDFAGARAVAENSAFAPDVRAMLINFVAGQWGRFDPEAAAAWTMQLPEGPQRNQALIGLGESWSDVDPARAAVFAANLPGGEARTLALRQAIAKWVTTDAEAARAWVVQTDRHEDFDQAVGAIATDPNLVSRDPVRALRWAATIFDDQLRTQDISTILFNWYPSDPNGVARYLESAPDFSAAQKADLLARLRASHASG